METKSLKDFATWARRELITQVSARLTAVLAPSSLERVEHPRTVAMLERDIAAAGGGAKGRDEITEKVAYTWFNRIIALRFMDANGYTSVGVVSPAHGQQFGQPEVLADAKRGSIDPSVVTNKRTLEKIMALLDGTRPSVDAQAESYAVLLAEYCRYWNRAMPFMFGREGDYTELLIPANLLAADSILARAVAALTDEVCREVEVIGWLYQYYISERKNEVFVEFKNGKKAGASEIPAATQLFTPHWIVRYLVENSVGRLWMLNHPDSRIIDQMEYYIAPVDEQTDFLHVSGPEELTVIDPACGSGHMLTYAFDLLYAIYEEEGYAPSEIPELILIHNLYGTEIDMRAGALAAFALTMKARARQRTFFSRQVEPRICVLDPISFSQVELDPLVTEDGDQQAELAFWNQFQHADTFGSLIRPNSAVAARLTSYLESLGECDDLYSAHAFDRAQRVLTQASYLSRKYAVVVANPPYMGRKNMNELLSQFLKQKYPDSKSDLFAAFIERCTAFSMPGGQMGFMTPYVWMYIDSYKTFRKRLLANQTITSLIELEYSGFDGATVPICTFTLQNGSNLEYQGGYVRLADFVGSKVQAPKALEAIKDQTRSWFYRTSAGSFMGIQDSPIVYWLSEKMLASFQTGKTLGEVANLRQGLATADNNRFIRQWWEVSATCTAFGCTSREEAAASRARWFPYNKGGGFRKWYGNHEHVVNWEHDGSEILAFRPRSVVRNPTTYFSPSVSWSKISSGAAAFRFYPPGFIYDVAGTSLFVDDKRYLFSLLSFANSQVAFELLTAIAPTLNFEVGQVKSLPIHDSNNDLRDELAARAVINAEIDWNTAETSWNFTHNPLIALSVNG